VDGVEVVGVARGRGRGDAAGLGEGEEDGGGKNLTLEEQIAMLFASETAPAKKPGSVKRLKLPGWK